MDMRGRHVDVVVVKKQLLCEKEYRYNANVYKEKTF